MNIKSLDNLILNGSIYELFTEVINNTNNFGIYPFTCTEKHNMRIDLISFDIYHNTNDIDILCSINGIYNPLTVKEDDIIYFVTPEELINIRSNTSIITNIIDSIKNANNGKQQKLDKNKSKDNASKIKTENNKKLPPHIIQSETGNIKYGEGSVILSPNF